MSAIADLHELCDAIAKAVAAMRHFSGAASQAEGAENWDQAKDMWRRYDHEANALISFSSIIAARNPYFGFGSVPCKEARKEFSDEELGLAKAGGDQ